MNAGRIAVRRYEILNLRYSIAGLAEILIIPRGYGRCIGRRVLIELPDGFNNRRVEIIVLTVAEPPPVHRRPHPDIAGQIKIHGDILNSVPETELDLPR